MRTILIPILARHFIEAPEGASEEKQVDPKSRAALAIIAVPQVLLSGNFSEVATARFARACEGCCATVRFLCAEAGTAVWCASQFHAPIRPSHSRKAKDFLDRRKTGENQQSFSQIFSPLIFDISRFLFKSG